MIVILGGTFETLHLGHRTLLDKAREFDEIIIGLSSDKFAAERKSYKVSPYSERKERLLAFFGKDSGKVSIFALEDDFGIALSVNADAIIVSEETMAGAEKINEKRKEQGVRELEIIALPMVQAEDGQKLSCDRIKKGEISEEGKAVGK